LALFGNRGMEKRCICRSLFSYDLLINNYSLRFYMEVGQNILSANTLFTAGLKQGWHFNQLRLLVAL